MDNIPSSKPHLMVHLSINGQRSCSHLLAVMNDAAMSKGEPIFLPAPPSIIPDIYPEVELLCPLIILRYFLRNSHAVLHSRCTVLRSRQQCTKGPLSPHPLPTLVISFFLIVAILLGGTQYLTLFAFFFLICISLITSVP